MNCLLVHPGEHAAHLKRGLAGPSASHQGDLRTSAKGHMRRPRIVTPASVLSQQAVDSPFKLLRNVLHQKSLTSKLAFNSKPDESNAAALRPLYVQGLR
jgi:hypothetical protein